MGFHLQTVNLQETTITFITLTIHASGMTILVPRPHPGFHYLYYWQAMEAGWGLGMRLIDNHTGLTVGLV